MSIKQTVRHTTPDGHEDRIPKCWEQGNDLHCIRIETASGEMFLLPYQQFISAHYHRQDDGEVIKLAFLSYDVRIGGRDLGALVNALQDFAVKRIAPMPTRYQNLIAKTEPAILEIEIEPIEKPS